MNDLIVVPQTNQWQKLKALVLDSVSSPITKRVAGLKNGELLRRAEEQFDLFITAGKNIRFQQNLKERRIAILVLPSNRLTVWRAILTDIQSGIAQMVAGGASQYVELPWPR
jgi:hypothetical protein